MLKKIIFLTFYDILHFIHLITSQNLQRVYYIFLRVGEERRGRGGRGGEEERRGEGEKEKGGKRKGEGREVRRGKGSGE